MGRKIHARKSFMIIIRPVEKYTLKKTKAKGNFFQ